MPAHGHPTSVVWSPANVELVTTLWIAGHSAQQIADRIHGASRSAVIGKIHRLGLARSEGRTKATQKLGAAAARATRGRGSNSRPPPPVRPPPMPPKARAKERKATGPLVALLDLGPRMCRFPFGDPQEPGFGFCGEVTELDKSYCVRCAGACYEPPKASAKSLERVLRRAA